MLWRRALKGVGPLTIRSIRDHLAPQSGVRAKSTPGFGSEISQTFLFYSAQLQEVLRALSII